MFGLCPCNAVVPLVIAVATLAVSPSVSKAQISPDERFFPAAEGDYWEFLLVEHTYEASPPPAYVSIRVGGDTTVAGEEYSLLLQTAFDDRTREFSHRTCGLRADSSGRFVAYDLSSGAFSCLTVHVFGIVHFDEEDEDEKVVIGGVEYDVAATAVSSIYSQGTGGSGGASIRKYAAGVGLYYYYNANTYHWAGGGGGNLMIYELAYAKVGGMVYGSPVSVEDLPHRPAATQLSAYPNPFRNDFRVTFDEVTEEDATLEVFDPMGRRLSTERIIAGSIHPTVSVRPGPAGVYFVRVTYPSGHQVTVPIVRIR